MKKQKINVETPQWLVTLGAAGAILFGTYPIIGNSFKGLSDIRLHRLGDKATTELIAGFWEGNIGFYCYALLLVVGYWLVKRAERRPKVFLWAIILLIPAFLILMGYIIWQDFPRQSYRADLLSEIMLIGLFMLFFPVIIDFVITSISKKQYGEKFWMIAGGYTAIYLFLWPAMIGDVLTMLNMPR